VKKLLAVPGGGFVENSVNVHRSDLIVVADWLEASVLFFQTPISKMDVRDFLCDNDYYQDQSFAMLFVELVWDEVRRRGRLLSNSYVLHLDADFARPAVGWRDALGHAFLLMLTCLQRYSRSEYPALFSASYIQQGSLFERFSEESLRRHGWQTLLTGWASGISNPDFSTIVNSVAQELDERWVNDDALPVFSAAKEEGLDIVAHRPFSDRRAGRAYFLIQCASGDNWDGKLNAPDLGVWSALISFVTPPRRGFCFPLTLDEDKFKEKCIRCGGLFLDRHRLLDNGMGLATNLSAGLKKDIRNWLTPRVAALPTA
jgi:hypothetical protein